MSKLSGLIITPNGTRIPLEIMNSDIDYLLPHENKNPLSYSICPHLRPKIKLIVYFNRNFYTATPLQSTPIDFTNAAVSKLTRMDVKGPAIIIFDTIDPIDLDQII